MCDFFLLVYTVLEKRLPVHVMHVSEANTWCEHTVIHNIFTKMSSELLICVCEPYELQESILFLLHRLNVKFIINIIWLVQMLLFFSIYFKRLLVSINSFFNVHTYITQKLFFFSFIIHYSSPVYRWLYQIHTTTKNSNFMTVLIGRPINE